MRKIILIILTFYTSHGLTVEREKSLVVTAQVMRLLRNSTPKYSCSDVWKSKIQIPGAKLETVAVMGAGKKKYCGILANWHVSCHERGVTPFTDWTIYSGRFKIAHTDVDDIVIDSKIITTSSNVDNIFVAEQFDMYNWYSSKKSDAYTVGSEEGHSKTYLYGSFGNPNRYTDAHFFEEPGPGFIVPHIDRRPYDANIAGHLERYLGGPLLANMCGAKLIEDTTIGQYKTKMPLAVFRQELEKE